MSLYSLAVSWEATGPSVPLETQNWLLQKAWTDTNRCTLPVNHCATMNHLIVLNLSGLDSRERWMHDDRVLRLHLIIILCIHIDLTCSYPRLWREVHEAWSLDHSGSTSGEDLLGNGGLLKLLRLVLQSSVDTGIFYSVNHIQPWQMPGELKYHQHLTISNWDDNVNQYMSQPVSYPMRMY